jgi:Fe-S-cluster containining protein
MATKNKNLSGLPEPPTASTKAKSFEKQANTLLKKLFKNAYPSCLSSSFRIEYEAVLKLFSHYQNTVLSSYPLPLTCGPCCGICCYHWPEDTYSFEVRHIADYLKKHRSKEIKKIVSTLKEDISCLQNIQDAVDRKFSVKKNRKALGDADPYDLVLSSFYQFKRPCVLLGKDGSCSIYPIRPLTCRVYISFSPKQYCLPSRIASDKALTCLLDFEEDTSELFNQLHFMYDTFDGDTSFRSMLYKALQ